MRIRYLARYRVRKTIVRLPDVPFGYYEMRSDSWNDGVDFGDSQAFSCMIGAAVRVYGHRIRNASGRLREMADAVERRRQSRIEVTPR